MQKLGRLKHIHIYEHMNPNGYVLLTRFDFAAAVVEIDLNDSPETVAKKLCELAEAIRELSSMRKK